MARANNLRVLAAVIAIVLAACLLMLARPAFAVITPTSTASDIASAVTSNPAFVSGASFEAVTGGTPNAVSDSALTSFPTNGADYGILTTGNANFADDPNDRGSTTAANGGLNVRGDTDYDVNILKVDLDVPSGANCLSVDFQFLSEEYPEFVGTRWNDAFIAELDSSTWTTSESTISAPNNFAFDPSHNVISINSSGVANMTAADSAGTTYDGGTQLLAAKTPITPGAHSLYLSIFDQGDNAWDSAVFLDNLDLYSSSAADCQTGAQLPDNLPPTADAGGSYEVNEGSSINPLSGTGSDPENGPLTYAWDLDNDGQYDDSTDEDPNFDASAFDGPSTHPVRLQVTDDHNQTDTATATVTVNNVKPTITSLSTLSQGALTGNQVTFTGQADDPANADDTAGFTWKWFSNNSQIGTSGPPNTGDSRSTSFPYSFTRCGNYSVSATATDKDNSESDPASLGSNPFPVYDGSFQPPIDGPANNLTLKGKVIPVKISVGCDGQAISGLSPTIKLLPGDVRSGEETLNDEIEAYSSSAADTTGIMRPVDGGYIYNLQVPGDVTVKAGDEFTVRVNPFGTHQDNPAGSMYSVLKIRK